MALTADTALRLSTALTSAAAEAEVEAAIAAGGTPTGIANTQFAAGALQSPSPLGTRGLGYSVGAGGVVTQATDRSTGVTLSTMCGQITTNNASLAAEAAVEFTVTNTQVDIDDVVVVSQASGSNGGNTVCWVSTTAAGSYKIKTSNNNAAGGTAETGAIILNVIVLKGAIT